MIIIVIMIIIIIIIVITVTIEITDIYLSPPTSRVLLPYISVINVRAERLKAKLTAEFN